MSLLESVNEYSNELLELLNRFNNSSVNSIESIDRKVLKEILSSYLRYNQDESEKMIKCEPISQGCAQGYLVSSIEKGLAFKEEGKDVLLISKEGHFTTIERVFDFGGLILLCGTPCSHAAIVAKTNNIPAVLISDEKSREALLQLLEQNDGKIKFYIDGSKGQLFYSECEIVRPSPEVFTTLEDWCIRTEKFIKSNFNIPLSVLGSADTPIEVKKAIEAGAKGIGNCRIEHMFLIGERLRIIQNLLILPQGIKRKRACEFQKEAIKDDVRQMIQSVSPNPFIIRLMDALPGELLPQTEEQIEDFCKRSELSIDDYKNYIMDVSNTSDDIRGVRFGIIKQDIYIAQIEGILTAAKEILDKGLKVDLIIIIPFTRDVSEVEIIRNMVFEVRNKLGIEDNANYRFRLGTMIELPRAAFVADKLSELCDIFIFGTNDLTHFTHALSRNHSNSQYEQLLPLKNPFRTLDHSAVGELMLTALMKGKTSNDKLLSGICGEHVNDPLALEFFVKAGIDFLGCAASNVLYMRTIILLYCLNKLEYFTNS